MSNHREDMRKAWAFVDEKYSSKDILGEKASQAILRLSARASHHEFPYGMGVMANLLACTNGAMTDAFPGSSSPLMLAVFNINFLQTRKSSGFAAGNVVGHCIDEAVAKCAKELAEEDRLDDSQAPMSFQPGRRAPPTVRVASSMLSSFTEAAFFQRCAGDWDQVPPSEKHNLSGRVFFGTLVNMDEAYRFFKMVGLINPVPGAKQSDSSSAHVVPDAASEVNKLFQTGTATLTTKTAGAFGQGRAPSISMGLTGNAHPSLIFPMLRGHFGSDAAAVSHRLLFTTGMPIEPHNSLPKRMDLAAGSKRWLWPPVLRPMVGPLGLPEGIDDYSIAAQMLKPIRETEEPHPSDGEGEDDTKYLPNSSGFSITLMDGCMTRLRFEKQQAENRETLTPQMRVANRDLELEAGMDIKAMAQRVLEHFKVAHKKLPWNSQARLAFKGFQAAFDARCAVARDAGQEETAACLGASPWHIAMLAAALLVLEIAVGALDAAAVQEPEVEVSHVVRAVELLDVFHGIRAIFEGHDLAAEEARQTQERLRVDAARRAAGTAAQNLMPSIVGEAFELTQVPPVRASSQQLAST